MYFSLKYIHVTAAIVTITGFAIRGYWMLIESDRLQQRWVRTAPHVVDTLFLLSGIALILELNLPVLNQPWLLMKFAVLVAYVFLGTIALKRGRTKQIRTTALVLALLSFLYIVGVALSKSVTSWLAWA